MKGITGENMLSLLERRLDNVLSLIHIFGGNWDGAIWIAGVFMVVVYTAGSCLVMWIGERITEYGVGNGISMIIFIGILSTAGTTIVNKFVTAFTDIPNNLSELWSILAFAVIAVVIFFAIVYVCLLYTS